jgi:GMP reductase
MDTVGTFEMANAICKEGCLVAMHKHYSVEEWTQWMAEGGQSLINNVFVSTGISDADMVKLDSVMAVTGARMICVDVANGYSEAFVQTVKLIRAKYPDQVIAAGNVVTSDMTEELIIAGADIVKVGIGPGSVCTTRRITGVGCPQFSAIIACADAAHGLGGRIISDGGCTCPGDICKAFGADADFVMLGGMLSGHDESAGELSQNPAGKWFKKFYGMSSAQAMNKYAGGVANYRASEGKCVQVEYRGPVLETMQDILGGLRSCCTYVGAATLKELPRRATFYRVSEQINNVFTESTKANPDQVFRQPPSVGTDSQ